MERSTVRPLSSQTLELRSFRAAAITYSLSMMSAERDSMFSRLVTTEAESSLKFATFPTTVAERAITSPEIVVSFASLATTLADSSLRVAGSKISETGISISSLPESVLKVMIRQVSPEWAPAVGTSTTTLSTMPSFMKAVASMLSLTTPPCMNMMVFALEIYSAPSKQSASSVLIAVVAAERATVAAERLAILTELPLPIFSISL